MSSGFYFFFSFPAWSCLQPRLLRERVVNAKKSLKDLDFWLRDILLPSLQNGPVALWKRDSARGRRVSEHLMRKASVLKMVFKGAGWKRRGTSGGAWKMVRNAEITPANDEETLKSVVLLIFLTFFHGRFATATVGTQSLRIRWQIMWKSA